MRMLIRFYKRISNTKALEKTSGKHEMMFFEHVYRITYLAGHSTSDESLGYRIYRNTVRLSIAMLICSELLYLFYDIYNLNVLIDFINISLIQFLAMYKFKNMSDHKDTMKKLASAMENRCFDTSTYNRQKILEMWTIRTKRYVQLVMGLGFSTILYWNIFPLLDDEEYNLGLTVHLPIDFDNNYRYPIVYILAQTAFDYAAVLVMVVDITILAHLMQLLCQYSILADCFENIIKDCSFQCKTQYHIGPFITQTKRNDLEINRLIADRRFQTKYTERLGDLIVQHTFLLRNTMDLRKILSIPMLCQLATSTILISSVAFQAAVSVSNLSKFIMTCVFFGYNMCELFIICRWCDDIKYQSSNISLAVYCSGWECGVSNNPGVRSRLLMVITRAAKPLVLTAGGMYDLSLVSLTSLVKLSYSALTVLLRVR